MTDAGRMELIDAAKSRTRRDRCAAFDAPAELPLLDAPRAALLRRWARSDGVKRGRAALLKDDDMPGGFVFIDEPFAHLDVRNIQLVGHFLKSTRAQYVLTTPITHNVEVFEPADITLVTAKKPRDARWAPPIGVLQRRVTGD